MANNFLNNAKIKFFKVVAEYGGASFTIPNTTVDGTDTVNLSSKWSTANVQGGTQSLVAYENVENPTVPIQLKFTEDLCREFSSVVTSYIDIIEGFANIQYPPIVGGMIKPPYCKISWDGRVYRGYFTNIRITLSGPYLKGKSYGSQSYRSQCEISAQFVISPKNVLLKNGNVNIMGSVVYDDEPATSSGGGGVSNGSNGGGGGGGNSHTLVDLE